MKGLITQWDMAYTQFSSDVVFEIFVVNWLSTKYSLLKFYWQNFGLYINRRVVYRLLLPNSYAVMFDTCKEMMANLAALKAIYV